MKRKPWLRTLIVLGIAASCGPRVIEDDGEERFRRCTFILGTGVTADGTPRRTNFKLDYNTHQLCTCSTDEETLDFSPGGYREYINELGFEMCKELAKEAELVTHDCEESYEKEWFTLGYGRGPGNSEDLERCNEDEAAGCQGS